MSDILIRGYILDKSAFDGLDTEKHPVCTIQQGQIM